MICQRAGNPCVGLCCIRHCTLLLRRWATSCCCVRLGAKQARCSMNQVCVYVKTGLSGVQEVKICNARERCYTMSLVCLSSYAGNILHSSCAPA
jgi:hypothetical protein